MSTYRVRITYTYSSTANATTAATNINNVLAGQGRPERAVRTNAAVELMVVGLVETEAKALHAALNTAAHSAARAGGKFSIVRTPDLD